MKDSSGEHGSEITSTSGEQGESSQPGASAAADSSANKSGASAPPNIVAAQEESAEEDSPHVVSSQEEAIAELRKVATTKKPGEWISVVKVDGEGATEYTALVSATHDIQQVQSGVADPKVYKNSRGKQAENQAANELKKTSRGGILNAGGVGGNEGVKGTTFTQGSMIPGKILKTKPKYSPIADKWLENGGQITIEDGDWKYTNSQGTSVTYKNGYPDFKGSGHVKQEVNIGGFTNRPSDFRHADQMAPNGPKSSDSTWHHNEDGKTLQEVNFRIHKQFTHRGGFSIKKKGE